MTPQNHEMAKKLSDGASFKEGGHPKPLALHAGLPALDKTAETISWFEFAPAKLFYTPILLYCIWLTIRYRGITLPTGANPALPYAGLVGESKYTVLKQMSEKQQEHIAPYDRFMRWGGEGGIPRTLDEVANTLPFSFPYVAKPDIGMRGAGVQVIRSNTELKHYVERFPVGAHFLLQDLIDKEGEAGVFYVRYPHETKGRIISLTLKYFPSVTGDGKSTLGELIAKDPRAGKLMHLYLDRHKARLNSVLAVGEKVRLAFAGNHCRGTIFRNGNDFITEKMTTAFDQLATNMGEFYIGRFDVRFDAFSDLQSGHGFRIIEINGAGGEATHIWDSRMTLRGAYKALMGQYKHLYAIGAANKKRGFTPTPLWDLLKAWQHEKKLTKHYPITH